MIPNGGYAFDQCSWKQGEREPLLAIFNPIKTHLKNHGMESYFTDENLSKIDGLPLSLLNEIAIEWPKKALEMEMIHFKFAITREHRLILKLALECQQKVIALSSEIELIEYGVRLKYSEVVRQNAIFNDFFAYSEFKEQLSEVLANTTLTYSKIIELKKEDMFAILRKRVISQKAVLFDVLTRAQSNMVHINEIKEADLKTYHLLRAELFDALSNDTFGYRVPYGKATHTEIIRPSHAKAASMKVTRTEMAYLTMSLEPIVDMEIEQGKQIEFTSGLKFDITSKQHVVQKEMFYELKLDKTSSCNLIIPIYFSFIRCNLVKEQRMSYRKIETDLE